MNNTSISVIKAVINDITDVQTLKEISQVKEWQFNDVIKKLIQEGFIKKEGNTIELQKNAKSILLKKISQKWNLINLLHGSNELVFSYLTEPLSINEILTNTGLSTTTIYRAISDLAVMGIIQKETSAQDSRWGEKISERICINPTKTELIIFAQILKMEREKMYEPDAEIIYSDKEKIIKKVVKGKITDGELTGFSLFTDNGIRYDSPYDYYVKQKEPLDIHDIIIHSVLSSYKDNDKLGLIISIVFYLYNKNKIDTKRLRKIATSFGISSIWLDVESYIRRQKLKDESLFLPWNEFISKAELYQIEPEKYVIPTPTPTLFEEIGNNITNPLRIFLIGGENMRLKNLKAVTKDCDMIVENVSDFEILCKVFTEKLGYEKMIKTRYSKEDLRIYPDEILTHPDKSRIDIFTKIVLRDLSLSDMMIQTADYIEYGKLKVGILRNEYVFLLKAVASREGDIRDMALLTLALNQSKEFEHGKFDWEEVWREIIHQEKMNPVREILVPIFDQISLLAKQTGMVIPILGKLQRHVIDQLILRLIRGGRQPLKKIVSLLIGGDISEQMLRNRIDALVKEGIIRKYNIKKEVFVTLVNIPHFPYKDMSTTLENIEKYLSWRFPIREQPTPLTIKTFVGDLHTLGYNSIGYVDNLVIQFLDRFLDYEQLYFLEKPHNSVGSVRTCIGLSDPVLGKNSKSDFYILNFENFIRIENEINGVNEQKL